MSNFLRAIVRPDLFEDGVSVPVGNGYISDDIPRPFRWVNHQIFQIKIDNEWKHAESIDFEFIEVSDEVNKVKIIDNSKLHV